VEHPDTIDGRIAALAATQHGLVTRAQLLRAGVPPERVRWRVRVRRLLPVYRGVYRVGPVVAPRAPELAAVLACGPGAAISHMSAAAMWSLSAAENARADVHVTQMQHGRGRWQRGICLHRVRKLPRDEITAIDSVPVTTIARTILDVAGTASRSELERMIALAEREHDVARAVLIALVDRYPTRRGARTLRALLGAPEDAALTRSQAEERLLRLLRRAQLPPPQVNARVVGIEVDFFWRAERLIVEVDGFAFHSSRSTFESDRRRDTMLLARGYRVLRLTWRQISNEPEATLVRIGQALVHPLSLPPAERRAT
jgi:very-short-patch-repair endonuclease